MASKKCPGLGLILIGDGPLRPEMQDWIVNRGLGHKIRFTGLIPYDRMPYYYSMADVFATPSVSEVHPFTIIEAMASGLPVLGIDSPGVSDTVLNGKTGYICETQDLAQYSEKMIEFAVQQEHRHLMGQQARLESRKYDIQNTMELMLDRYQSVIDRTVTRRQLNMNKTSIKL